MIFYKVVDKKTGNQYEVNKVFFGGDYAQVYSDDLNKIYGPSRNYKPFPFIYILSKEEKEKYMGTIKTKNNSKKVQHPRK